jgi:hypothetical protein
MAKLTLSKDVRGNFKKDLGWKPVTKDGGEIGFIQQQFYLGRDHAQALLRSLALDGVWDGIVKRWQRDWLTPWPVWDEITLQIGSAVARGDERAVLRVTDTELAAEHEADPAAAVAWLQGLQDDFPGVRLALENERVQSEGRRHWEDMAKRLEEEGGQKLAQAARVVRKPTGQTLHQALDAYAESLPKTVASPTSAKKAADEARVLKDHAKDMPLAALGLQEIEDFIAYWQKRTMTRRKKPFAVQTVKDQIKRFRHFLRWLHKSPALDWRKPSDYEVLPIRVRHTPAELAEKLTAEQVDTYTVDELATLYEYATPVERLYMLLALNCDFGNMEIATLQVKEIFFDYTHQSYPLSGNFIRKIRHKSGVYGEWRLWPETVAGLRWYLARRPQTKETVVFVSKLGKPISTPTPGNNPNRRIFNTWSKLCDRIAKDFPTFRRLSFNKLRKTAANMVKRVSGGEVAGVFQCHGNPVRTDELSDLYNNRPFDKVHEATEQVRQQLAPMFARV